MIPVSPKRRWFQFSLMTMLMAMTLVGVVLGRVAYLEQRAAFHENESIRYSQQSRDLSPFDNSIHVTPSYDQELENARLISLIQYHLILSKRYRQAVWRPWTIVDETHANSP